MSEVSSDAAARAERHRLRMVRKKAVVDAGIAAANISLGNFETMGRTPVDPLGIDGIEVSRGPNANVFGLGNPSGTVNQVPVSANLTRDKSRAEARVDSYEGYRTSLDLNRVIKKGVLAFRASGAFR